MKEKGNPHRGKPPNPWKDQWSQRDLQEAKESAAAGLRTEKQSGEKHRSSESLVQIPQPEKLRWWLGAETETPEVSPWEQAGVGGVETT